MMAIGHVVTGAAAGLYATSLAQQEGAGTLLVGALVCAGAALVPDLDHPGATAARTFGGASEAVARAVASASRGVHRATRARWDREDSDGHRTVTHTLVFAVAAGLAAWVLARVHPALVVFPLACLGVRALMPNLLSQRDGWAGSALRSVPVVVLLGAALTWVSLDHLVPTYNALWLGAMTGLGCFVHCLGDSLTRAGCPWLWPVKIMGRRWYSIGSPAFLRFTAGGRAEKWVVVPVLTLGALVIGGVMVLPQVLVGLLP